MRSLIGPLSGVHLIKKKGIKDGDIKEGARVKRERERERERERPLSLRNGDREAANTVDGSLVTLMASVT